MRFMARCYATATTIKPRSVIIVEHMESNVNKPNEAVASLCLQPYCGLWDRQDTSKL